MGFPLYFTCCFSLAAFNILSLFLVFVSLISMCLGVFLLGFILCGSRASWTWFDYFLFHVGEIFKYNLFKNFLIPCLLLFFWDPYNLNVGTLTLSQRSLRLSSVLLFVLLYSALQKLFPTFYLPAHWFIFLLQIFCYWFLLVQFSSVQSLSRVWLFATP